LAWDSARATGDDRRRVVRHCLIDHYSAVEIRTLVMQSGLDVFYGVLYNSVRKQGGDITTLLFCPKLLAAMIASVLEHPNLPFLLRYLPFELEPASIPLMLDIDLPVDVVACSPLVLADQLNDTRVFDLLRGFLRLAEPFFAGKQRHDSSNIAVSHGS
jgi:hypothetical protein